jgi:hypothetical protein
MSVLGCGRVEDGRAHQPARLGEGQGTGGAASTVSGTGGAASTVSSTGGATSVTTGPGGSPANGDGGAPSVTPPPPIVIGDDAGHTMHPDAAAAPDSATTGSPDAEGDAGARPDAAPSTTPPPNLSVASFDRPLAGITAAAWSQTLRQFFLLESPANRFWRVDPATKPATVQGPYAIPSGTVAPRAFAVSDSHVFAVVDAGIHRLPLEGAASGTPVPLSGAPSPKELTAAYTGGTLLVGDDNGPAQALADGSSAVTLLGTRSVGDAGVEGGLVVSVSGLYGVHQVASNGTDFVVSLPGAPGLQTHLVTPAALELNPSPCNLGSVMNLSSQLAVFGNTIAWVEQFPFSRPVRLRSATIVDGVCTDLGFVEFGMSLVTGTALGLVDENLALVIEDTSFPTVDIAIIDRRTAAMVGPSIAGLHIGRGHPFAFAMGLPHHAVLVSQDLPALLEF